MTAGAIMLDHLAETADRRDVIIIARITPIARIAGQLAGEFPTEAPNVDSYEVSGETGTTDAPRKEGTDGEG